MKRVEEGTKAKQKAKPIKVRKGEKVVLLSVRYLDIYEDEPLDEAQFAAWVKQASQLPGERM